MAQEGCDLATAEGRARFLAMARPLWTALPDGALKRQLLGDLAVVAKLDPAELSVMWQASPPTLRQPARNETPPRPRLVRAARQGAANQLDRALWLLLHRAEMWWDLDGHCHDLLADRVAPYAALFGSFERCLHDHGPLAPAPLLAELTQSVHEDEHARAALERIALFHEPEPHTDLRQQLDLILDHLRLRDVDAELEQLFESGLMSPDIQARSAELMQSRARLKATLSGLASSPA